MQRTMTGESAVSSAQEKRGDSERETKEQRVSRRGVASTSETAPFFYEKRWFLHLYFTAEPVLVISSAHATYIHCADYCLLCIEVRLLTAVHGCEIRHGTRPALPYFRWEPPYGYNNLVCPTMKTTPGAANQGSPPRNPPQNNR